MLIKVFLANSFVWGNNLRIGYLLCRHEKYTTYCGRCHKCNTTERVKALKCNVQVSELTGYLDIYKLILSISTEQCHKNSISKSQYGSLTFALSSLFGFKISKPFWPILLPTHTVYKNFKIGLAITFWVSFWKRLVRLIPTNCIASHTQSMYRAYSSKKVPCHL